MFGTNENKLADKLVLYLKIQWRNHNENREVRKNEEE